MTSKTGSLVVTTFVAALLLTMPLFAQREFTSNDGLKLRAGIVDASETDVTLKREKDAKVFTIPLSRLSETDREYVAAWLEKRAINTRPARTLTLAQEDGTTKTIEVPEGEYLSEDGTLTLYPGDTVHLEFDASGSPSVVREVKNPKRTVKFAMSRKEGITMLSRTTKMQETVAMDCVHRVLDREGLFRTNLRPSEKGLGAFDSWPPNVWMLKLSNFEVTDRPAQEVYLERVEK